jgi:hypothetical protein
MKEQGRIIKIGNKEIFIKFGESISKQIIEQSKKGIEPKQIEIKKVEIKDIKDYKKSKKGK